MSKIALLIFFVPLLGFGQNRYFVSFKDKTNTGYSTSDPLKFLSQKSIDRRTKENFSVIEEDLPVDTAYVHQVKSTGAKVFFSSRWFNGVLVQTDAATATAIVSLSFVLKVELVAPGAKLIGGRQSANQKSEQTTKTAGLNDAVQLNMIGLDQMHLAGYHGEGIDIAVFDDGFVGVNTLAGFQPLYAEGRIKAAFNFVNNTTDIYSADEHGTETLSILAGNIPATYLGAAYKANFFLYQTEDVTSEYRIEEYNWAFAAERADSAGVDVISSSLGYNEFDDASMNYTYANMDGKTAIISQAARKAFLRGIAVVNSAGNEGNLAWKYIDAPADVEGVIAVGSVDGAGRKSNFSSIGPTADGRFKPDVAALGSNTVLFTSAGCCSTGFGTSYSCPLVAGLVACLRQQYPQESAQQIYTRVTTSGSQANNPDNLLGYGIPNFVLTEIVPTPKNEIDVYPNPVTELLKLNFKDASGQPFDVSIYNATGQRVLTIADTITSATNPYPISFSSLAPGIYFVKIKTASASITQKVIRVN